MMHRVEADPKVVGESSPAVGGRCVGEMRLPAGIASISFTVGRIWCSRKSYLGRKVSLSGRLDIAECSDSSLQRDRSVGLAASREGRAESRLSSSFWEFDRSVEMWKHTWVADTSGGESDRRAKEGSL